MEKNEALIYKKLVAEGHEMDGIPNVSVFSGIVLNGELIRNVATIDISAEGGGMTAVTITTIVTDIDIQSIDALQNYVNGEVDNEVDDDIMGGETIAEGGAGDAEQVKMNDELMKALGLDHRPGCLFMSEKMGYQCSCGAEDEAIRIAEAGGPDEWRRRDEKNVSHGEKPETVLRVVGEPENDPVEPEAGEARLRGNESVGRDEKRQD